MDESGPGRISDLTGRAFACEDELGALMILTLLPGASAAGASAILTDHDQERYTVMDVRALRSLAARGLWDDKAKVERASCLYWPDYLAACRALASRTRQPLRAVDRALWLANGNPGNPGNPR